MKWKQKLSENILDKLSIDFLKNQVLKNAYGNTDTLIAKLDPRILIAWYLFFGIVPWFVNDVAFLLTCFLLVMITTWLAHVAGLVMFIFVLGVFSQTGYLLIVSLFFGGNASTILPLLILTLKVTTCSLASITVAALYPVFTFIYFAFFDQKYGHLWMNTFFAAILGGLVIYMHRANIRRLLNGTEYKFGQKKKE